MRSADGITEVAVPAYDVFASTELLAAMALHRMMAKLSTRRYTAGPEPVGSAVDAMARSTSKSAVSRRFVAATETVLAEMLAADLSELDLVALMIDGVHFADHLCVVALEASASTDQARSGRGGGRHREHHRGQNPLVGLPDRGFDTTRPILCVPTAPRRWWWR